MKNKPEHIKFYSQIKELLQSAKGQVVRSVNSTMVLTYFEIGRIIIEEEEQGKDRAIYGKKLLKGLSAELTKEFGKGFSVDNLEKMRRFFIVYSKSATVLRISTNQKDTTRQQKASTEFNLSWSHYLKLMRIDDEDERSFYEIETFKNNWSIRELQRQYDSALYTRLTLSRNKEEVKELSKKGLILEKPKDAIKDPYILEFIGLPKHSTYSENDLEQGLINKLENFLMELGTGFTFVARQKRISFDDKHFHDRFGFL